jgi:hypothetical protein
MRTKQIALLLLSLSFVACGSYKHLEDESEFGTSEHGSFIRVWEETGKNSSDVKESQGELIAIDADSLYALVYPNDGDTICIGIHRANINSFNLYYAKPNTSFWTIPVFTLFSASHGFFAIITAPLNIIATSLTQNYVLRKSRSQEGDLKLDELSTYARFPKGLPPGIRTKDIH